MNHKTQPAKRKTTYIVLSLLAAFSIMIIILASTVLFQLFFSNRANGTQQSRNLADFAMLYGDSNTLRDTPDGLTVVDSTCHIAADKKSFTYTLTLQNTAKTGKELLLQTFVNEQFVRAYGDGVQNPIIKVTEDDAYRLYPQDVKSFTYTGVIFGQGDDAIAKLKESLSAVYVEVFLSKFVGRLELPVRFVETEE